MTEWWGFDLGDNFYSHYSDIEDQIDYLLVYNDLVELSNFNSLSDLINYFFKLKRFNYFYNGLLKTYGLLFKKYKYTPYLNSHIKQLELIHQIYELLNNHSVYNFKYLSEPMYKDVLYFYTNYRSKIL